MDKIFAKAVEEIKEIEKDYADHPSDPGGKTRWGITGKVARAYGYDGPMNELPWKKAKEIYYKEFWVRHDYHKLKNRNIAIEMLEQGINLPWVSNNGRNVLKANLHLQKAYNLSKKPKKEEIKVDGLIGPKTINAVNSCSRVIPLFNILNGFQARHYLEAIEKNPALKSFIVGWFNKRIKIKKVG